MMENSKFMFETTNQNGYYEATQILVGDNPSYNHGDNPSKTVARISLTTIKMVYNPMKTTIIGEPITGYYWINW